MFDQIDSRKGGHSETCTHRNGTRFHHIKVHVGHPKSPEEGDKTWIACGALFLRPTDLGLLSCASPPTPQYLSLNCVEGNRCWRFPPSLARSWAFSLDTEWADGRSGAKMGGARNTQLQTTNHRATSREIRWSKPDRSIARSMWVIFQEDGQSERGEQWEWNRGERRRREGENAINSVPRYLPLPFIHSPAGECTHPFFLPNPGSNPPSLFMWNNDVMA